MEALTKNQTIKVFDYSLNKLGESKNSLSEKVAECLRKNRTLIHLDLSSNYFNEKES